MLIIGTGGLASDILNTLCHETDKNDIVLFNDIEPAEQLSLNKHFRILGSKEEARSYFESSDRRFITAVGNNMLRERLSNEFRSLGGINPSYISRTAYIGNTAAISPDGVFIMQHTTISDNVQIDEGCILYVYDGIGHNSHIHKYSLVSSHVSMSKVSIGAYSTIGIGVKFKPDVRLGSHCLAGTGAVITKSFGDHSVLYGVPAKQMN